MTAHAGKLRHWGLAALVVVFALGMGESGGQYIGTPAYAGGDGGSTHKAPEQKAPKTVRKKAYVPNTDDLRADKGPQAKMHDRLENYARGDSLKGLATDLKRIKKFRRSLERLINRARTTQQKKDANNILSQLQSYRKQTKNKALRANANRLLKSLVALDARDRVIAAEKAFYKAKLTTKNALDDLNTHEDYKAARAEYIDTLKKVPKVPRNQFERFDKTLMQE